jgi:zinc protease
MSVDRTELPPIGPDPRFTFPRPVKQTLANGLTIWAVEHGAMPVVSACLLLHCGSASDPANHGGLGSLTASLLDESSGSSGRHAIANDVALKVYWSSVDLARRTGDMSNV